MFYITGDPHGDFRAIRRFAKEEGLCASDVIVVLGDAGVNYFLNERDRQAKKLISKIPATVFCIHGNHEARPESLPDLYHEEERFGGTVFVEDAVPNLLFARDGEVYNLGGMSALVVGGAYSIDKWYRLERGWSWFADEQPSEESKARALANMEARGWQVDLVLTHTCPVSYEPKEAYMEGVDQSAVDKTTERWLDMLERKIDYGRWWCGHWHIEKEVERVRFLFHSIVPLTDGRHATATDDAPPRILYTADLHLGHENIIRFCDRPFGNAQVMDDVLIANWNARVRECDTVWVLGDMIFRSSTPPGRLLGCLNGHKRLIVGNHDAKWMKQVDPLEFFESVDLMATTIDAGRTVTMCHYPMMAWPGRNAYHVFGHIHNNVNDGYWPLLRTYERALNAGVDVNGFVPATLDELIRNNRAWRKRASDGGKQTKR